MIRTSSKCAAFPSICSLALAVVLLGAGAATPRSWGQEPTGPAQPAIQSVTELVKIDVSVQDQRGDFVGGLLQEKFRVLDGAEESPIVLFAPVEAPAQVLVIVETSPAVYLIHDQHLSAAYALIDGLTAEDQVALITYDQAPHVILGLTPEKSQLAAALRQIQYTIGMGELNFYDSVSTALDWLAPIHGKKALLLLTTGLDSSSPARWDLLVQKIQADDVVIFPVALGGSLRQPGSRKKNPRKPSPPADSQAGTEPPAAANPVSFTKADDALRLLAKMTGGRAYFPESAREFVPIYREIASALRHQYVLGIAPQHDGKFHALTVRAGSGQPSAAKGSRGEYRVFAREGYLAPAP